MRDPVKGKRWLLLSRWVNLNTAKKNQTERAVLPLWSDNGKVIWSSLLRAVYHDPEVLHLGTGEMVG
jgi:hypothetical protein